MHKKKKVLPLKDEGPFFSAPVEELIQDFQEARAEMKKPMTSRALKMLRKIILEQGFKGLHTEAEVKSAIQKAILAGWLTVYFKELPPQEKRDRWWQMPEEFYPYFSEEERKTLFT